MPGFTWSCSINQKKILSKERQKNWIKLLIPKKFRKATPNRPKSPAFSGKKHPHQQLNLIWKKIAVFKESPLEKLGGKYNHKRKELLDTYL